MLSYTGWGGGEQVPYYYTPVEPMQGADGTVAGGAMGLWHVCCLQAATVVLTEDAG